MEDLLAILQQVHAGPTDYSMTEAEILGYDDDGIRSSPTLVVDTSIFMAIALEEHHWMVLTERLRSADVLNLSAASHVELSVVLFRRFGEKRLAAMQRFMEDLLVRIVPFDKEQALLAREAYRGFGRGRHPTARNFGDCFSYALAKHLNEDLLFKICCSRAKTSPLTHVLVANPSS